MAQLMFLLALIVIAAFALYVMSPGERGQLLQTARNTILQIVKTARQRASTSDPFSDALIARTRLPLATLTITAANVLIFFSMLVGTGSFSDPQTLLNWGANFGPRTTNGEWWRVITATFVHAGLFHLIFSAAGTVQLGFMLERLVGHTAFAIVYLSGGLFASLVSLSADPIAVTVGPAGAILSLYGLLAATVLWGKINPSPVAIPLNTLKALAPGAGLFALHVLFTRGFTSAELFGFMVGLVYGVVLCKDISALKPKARLIAWAAVTTVIIGAGVAIAVRGVSDVRPEIARIVAVEDRTASLYQKAVGQFRLGAINAKSLAQLIDGTIVPEVQDARVRLKKIEGVPSQHAALVANADEYLRLRDESWRIRSDALHNGNMPGLVKADRAERASLDALDKVRNP